MPRTTASDIASLVVGRAIRHARHEVGMTQAELARRLSASPPYVSALENGKGNLTVGQLSAVASALGVELHVAFSQPPPRAEPKIPEPPPLASTAGRPA